MPRSTLSLVPPRPPDAMPDRVLAMTVVSDYDEIEELLTSADFARTDPMSTPFKLETLGLTHGEEHSRRRRLESKHFRPIVLKDRFGPVVSQTTKLVLGSLFPGVEPAERIVVDLVKVIPRISTLAMAEFVGLELDDDRLAAVDELMEHMNFVNGAAGLMFSQRDPIDEAWEIRQGLVRFTERYVMPAIERRRHGQRTELQQDDVISNLVDNYDPTLWDGELITREATFFMAGGVKTTTNSTLDTIPHLLGWLDDHPESVAHALDPSNDFLNRVVSESLRLQPPNPALTRVALRSGVTKSGREYREGEQFVLRIPVAHLDRAIFGDDAPEFNPYRATRKGTPIWGLAFGYGHHTCIGRSLAAGRFDDTGNIQGYEGTMVTILRELVALGIDLAPPNRPEYSTDTSRAVFSTFPVSLCGPDAGQLS